MLELIQEIRKSKDFARIQLRLTEIQIEAIEKRIEFLKSFPIFYEMLVVLEEESLSAYRKIYDGWKTINDIQQQSYRRRPNDGEESQ